MSFPLGGSTEQLSVVSDRRLRSVRSRLQRRGHVWLRGQGASERDVTRRDGVNGMLQRIMEDSCRL